MGNLSFLDSFILFAYGAMVLGIGYYFSRTKIKNTDDFLIAGRKLPWWVIGFSNCATYQDGGGAFVFIFFAGGFMYLNQIAWIAWPIWMPLFAIFWAKLWRRSKLVTTGEIIELRYSGKRAGIFRGFFGIYAMLFWAVLLLGYGSILAGELFAPLLGWEPASVIWVFGGLALAYTLLSGLYGVAYTDVPQFLVFFFGSMVLVWVGVADQGGYTEMLHTALGKREMDFWQIIPPSQGSNSYIDPWTLIMLLVLGFLLPGSPFAGEGWTAQRMLAAKNERHAVVGTMFNCVLSLVVRLIPIILMAVLAIAIFPKPGDPGSFPPIETWPRLLLYYSDKMPGLMGILLAGGG